MTAQQRTRVTWVAVVGGLAALISVGSALLAGTRGVARAAASEQIAPVAERVSRLEERNKAIDEQLAGIKRDTACIVRMHMRPPQTCGQ